MEVWQRWARRLSNGQPAAEPPAAEPQARAYVARQEADVEALRKDESVEIPDNFDFGSISGLSSEARQKLISEQPATLAQAARIDGMTPAALLLVRAHIRKTERRSA